MEHTILLYEFSKCNFWNKLNSLFDKVKSAKFYKMNCYFES